MRLFFSLLLEMGGEPWRCVDESGARSMRGWRQKGKGYGKVDEAAGKGDWEAEDD